MILCRLVRGALRLALDVVFPASARDAQELDEYIARRTIP